MDVNSLLSPDELSGLSVESRRRLEDYVAESSSTAIQLQKLKIESGEKDGVDEYVSICPVSPCSEHEIFVNNETLKDVRLALTRTTTRNEELRSQLDSLGACDCVCRCGLPCRERSQRARQAASRCGDGSRSFIPSQGTRLPNRDSLQRHFQGELQRDLELLKTTKQELSDLVERKNAEAEALRGVHLSEGGELHLHVCVFVCLQARITR
jgi:hypothetical protein